MILYHGSNVAIESIDLTKSKRYKDFGRAFYLSAGREQAVRMAEAKTVQFGGEVLVTAFEFDEECLEGLSVMSFPRYSREWAEFVYNNRDEQQDFHHDYDIVYGPIANDYIGLQIRDYRRQRLTFEQFMKNILYHQGETFQYAFCTEASIAKLKKI